MIRSEYLPVKAPKCYVKSCVTGLGLERDKIYKVMYLGSQSVIIHKEYSWPVEEFNHIRNYDQFCFDMQDGGNILCDKDGNFDPDDAWNGD